jgi:hypothetical protein
MSGAACTNFPTPLALIRAVQLIRNQSPLSPNEELDGDTSAALAGAVSVGTAISVTNARAVMNFFMTHLFFVRTLRLRVARPLSI